MTAYVPPVTHHDPTTAQVVAIIGLTVFVIVAIVIAFVALIQFCDYLADRKAAGIEQAALDADAARSFAHAFVPQLEDVADLDAALPSMPGVVVREPVQGKPGRLVEHRERYGA